MRFFLTLVLCGLFNAASAHEFWISPQSYTVDAEGDILADIRIGQEFRGSAYAFNTGTFARFDVIRNGETLAVKGQLGDRPALTFPAGNGLSVIVHETAPERLTYANWAKFQTFVDHKNLDVTQAMHLERGLPEEKFAERYVRYAKSLVASGTAQGQDIETGMKTEIIALDNPYTDDLSAGLRVRVLRDGSPRPDAQVEIFAKQGDAVTVTLTRTDANGVATILTMPNTEYLIDAVYLEPTDGDAVWQSFWASLTFKTP